MKSRLTRSNGSDDCKIISLNASIVTTKNPAHKSDVYLNKKYF